jgi:crotonobetainyl-CoA:carnitine CoA-transferase CaiB-like acyl-CoA transferase
MFKNLKVIELASVLAGPAVGMFFAELGAKVIKIENKTTKGDVTRSWKLPTEDKNASISAYYCSVNWNKESLFLDLRNTEDKQKVYDLMQDADIVIANFKHGDAEKLGMNYEVIKTFQPNIIYGEITAFGKNEKRLGFDVVLQAEAGFMFMNGEAKGNIVKMPVALIDILTAHQLKEAILLALLKRQTTGKGSYVSVSLMETAIASLANQATNWLMGGHIPQRMGTAHPNIAPYGDIFQTSDEKLLVLAVGNDKQFARMCETLEQNKLATDKRFANNSLRVKNRVILQAILAPIFANYQRDKVLKLLTEKGVPAAAIRNMQEVFEQKIAQNMVLTQTFSNGTETKCVKTIAFDTHFLDL